MSQKSLQFEYDLLLLLLKVVERVFDSSEISLLLLLILLTSFLYGRQLLIKSLCDLFLNPLVNYICVKVHVLQAILGYCVANMNVVKVKIVMFDLFLKLSLLQPHEFSHLSISEIVLLQLLHWHHTSIVLSILLALCLAPCTHSDFLGSFRKCRGSG